MTRRALLASGLALAGRAAVDLRPLVGSAWAAPVVPPIVDCKGWAARANREIVPVWNQRPVKILLHHTATPNQANVSQDAAFVLARSIQKFHMDGRGWLDTGQHFTVSRGGFAMEGRHRSLGIVRAGRQQVEGAHCTGQNVVAIGIENEGTYTAVNPPVAQWNRLRDLCAWICRQYGIRPTELYGHRDFKNTACPGDHLYALLPKLRAESPAPRRPRAGRSACARAWVGCRPSPRSSSRRCWCPSWPRRRRPASSPNPARAPPRLRRRRPPSSPRRLLRIRRPTPGVRS